MSSPPPKSFGPLALWVRHSAHGLYVCHEYSINLLLEFQRALLERDARADEKLRLLIQNHVRILIDEMGSPGMTAAFGQFPRELFCRSIQKRDLYEAGLRRILREGMDKKIFVEHDPKLVTLAILGGINGIASWYRPDGKSSTDEIGKAFAELFVRGLAASPPAPARKGRARPPRRNSPAS
jgi:tetracycline repressor-like protein